jgi:hypothetical protein
VDRPEGKVISLADELALRALLLSAQNLLWEWLPQTGGPSDATTVALLRGVFAEEGRRLAHGSSRLARAAGGIIEILDRDASTPRATIDALWKESAINAPWLRQLLKSPERFTFSYGEADNDA